MIEQWKAVKDFEGVYEVSNLGRVKRIALGLGTNAKDGILKPGLSKKGYPRVYLSKHSKKYTKPLHILVAQAFIPNPHNLPQVNHKDGNKLNASVENLEWTTQKGNMLHSAKLGLHGDGVYYDKGMERWVARYYLESKRINLGTFTTKEEALKVRQDAVNTL